MVSNTTITIIIISLIVFVAIIGVAIFFLVRRNNNGGTTGSTGTTGSIGSICSSCTVVKNGCSANGVLKIGYTGANCSQTCQQTSSTVALAGCVAPVCGSPYCTPQATLYTNLKSDGTLTNFCSDGIGTALPPNTCNVSLTAQQLGALIIPPSSIVNSIIKPVFITPTRLSIYQTTQPIAQGNIPQESIEIHTTNPTIINNPYVLYFADGILSFQRVNDILSSGNINNAIWIYNVDSHRLVLFANINQDFSPSSTILVDTAGDGFYFGPNNPCGIMTYGSPAVSTNVYNANSGLFSSTEKNYLGDLVNGTYSITIDSNGNHLAASNNNTYDFLGCFTRNKARWYGISAINTFLGS